MSRGLFIGRFQPFHKGHSYVVEYIASQVDLLIIGVGSADKSHTEENPFTAGERVELVHRATDHIEDCRIVVVPIVDIDRNAVWVGHVESLCPPFDVVFSNNTLVESLFEERDYEVEGTPLQNRDTLSGEAIRKRMAAGDESWRDDVPDAVATCCETLGLEQRVQMIFGPDDA